MSASEPHEIELRPAQWAWLEAMAERYGLADPGKAVRCLINFAADEAEHEAAIFQEIRCQDC
jgi:hypothetical protein